MEMMRAVLDSNFWLATHVVVHHRRLLGDVPRRVPRDHLRRARRLHPLARSRHRRRPHRMVYGIVCFATLLQLCRHRARRHLGRPILGPLLGLGSEGKRRPHHRAVERHHAACALGRHGPAARPGRARGLRQHRHRLELVRREHARRGPAQLWFQASHGGIRTGTWLASEEEGIIRREWHRATA
jgi:hypothetical protein